jgi:hypothetical protein|tara:strand:- start:276 stop:773 length:498 start_codon:yes stop_codon:yes gene_type:complete
MANFSKKTKQRIIDDYLQATGANMYVPSEFVSWLSGQPEHEAYSAFYGMDDIDAAYRYRIDMARRLASGLRIVVKNEDIESTVLSFRVAEYPAYISPVANRRDGGGYEPFDPSDVGSQAELRRQAGVSLASWLERYRGCAEHIGLDMSSLEGIVHVLRDSKDDVA